MRLRQANVMSEEVVRLVCSTGRVGVAVFGHGASARTTDNPALESREAFYQAARREMIEAMNQK